MKRAFVDSNLFLRFFFPDDPAQYERAKRFFQNAAQGDIEIFVGPPVLFEVAWVLKRVYRLPRERIHEYLTALVSLRGLNVMDHAVVQESLRLMRDADADFADAYIAASIRKTGVDEVATFNRKHFEPLGVPLTVL